MQSSHIEQQQGQSLQGLHNEQNEISVSQRELSSQKSKVYSKIESNKQFNCLCIFKNTLYLGTRKCRIYIYEIEAKLQQQEGQEELGEDFVLRQVKMITPQFKTVAMIRANEEYFVTVPQTDDESFISIWSATTKQFLVARQGHKSQVSQIIFMKKQNYLASSSWDSTVKIWSLQNFGKVQAAKTYKGNYPILQLKEFDDDVLIFGGDDCYLVFWNWKKGEVIKKQFGHAGSVMYIEIMREFVFTAGGDNKFKFWQVIFMQATQTSISTESIDFRQKYRIKKISEHQQNYDSIVFGMCYDIYLLLIDKQGEVFLFTEQAETFRMGNYFDSNEMITGFDVFGDFLLVTTTKGVLKHINLRSEISKLTFSFNDKKAIPSENRILQIDSNLEEYNAKEKKKINFNKNGKQQKIQQK